MSLRRPPVRSFRSGFRRRLRKRRLAWRAFSVGTGTLGPDNSVRLILLNSQVDTARWMNPTIMRIRGELLVVQDQAPGVIADQANLYWGIQLSDHNQGDPGNVFENPFTHSFSNDWMWWGAHFLYNAGPTQVGVENSRNSVTGAVRTTFDIRAKRRMDETDDLVLIALNAAPAVQPVDLGAVFTGRILIQET